MTLGRFSLITSLLFIMTTSSYASGSSPTLRAGLEPFPPQITEQKTGYSVEWLKQLSSAAGFAISSDNPKLLARLNDAVSQIDTQSIYKDYVDQFDWPGEGFISAGKLKLPERE